MVTSEYKLTLFADYFQFYIQDEKVEGDLSDEWTEEATQRLLAVTEGTVGIGTARNMDVPVTIKIFGGEPPVEDLKDIVGRINECDLEVKSGKIVVAGCTDYFPDATKIELDNGIYRVRIYYVNLDKISDDGLTGEDRYEIHLWLTGEKKGMKTMGT
jgi:hypothetical protein